MKLGSRMIAMLLALTMLLICAGCGQTGAPEGSGTPAAGGSAAPETSGGEGASYVMGYNNFGQGAYPLDLNEANTKYALECMGMEITVVNNQFTVDKLITDAQNQIAQGVDGMVFWSAADTLFQPFSELCESTQTPFVLADKYPISTDTMDMLRENPYFVGAISTDDKSAGYEMAQMALEDGYKTAVIISAAVGDINNDLRCEGFEEGFTAGGGQVLTTVHCADPSEAVQKANDVLSAYGDVDCAYTTSADYAVGLISALESAGRAGEIPIYSNDVDPTVISGIRDGYVVAAKGAAGPYCGGLAAALLVNYLDGHPVLDENGQAPMTNTLPFIDVDADNVDDFETYWIENQIFTPEDYQNLLYRYNPDVTWQDYLDVIANYTFENMIAGK